MRTVFADSLYWLAVANPRDPWRAAARATKRELGAVQIVTTDEVLAEFLTGLCRSGSVLRRIGAEMVRAIFVSPEVRVVPQSRESFRRALERYAAREDKAYSLTDCAAMNAMDAEGIKEVLTSDRHFEQDGYVALMKK